MPIKTDLQPRNLCENDLGQGFGFILNTGEPEYNKGPRDWQNVSAIKKIHSIEVLFLYILLLLGWGKLLVIPKSLLCRGLLYWESFLVTTENEALGFFYRVPAKNWGFGIQSSLKLWGGGGGICQLIMGGAASIKWSHTSWGGQWCRGWENRRGKG